jgi:isoamylase
MFGVKETVMRSMHVLAPSWRESEGLRRALWGLALLALGWGMAGPPSAVGDEGDGNDPCGTPGLGARFEGDGSAVLFRVFSAPATRLEVAVFAAPSGAAETARFPMAKEPNSSIWTARVPVAELRDRGVTTVYYGFRAWGPNWPFDPSWKPGSGAGFVRDVDDQGNRFNPNKLLLDPYALEVSHDPVNAENRDGTVYASGPAHRLQDTGPAAPKGIVLMPDQTEIGIKPTRPLKDEIIYEVHVRGLTRNDTTVPEELRGTYAGAALKAPYFQDLGVTAVEFLPVQETPNDQNDLVPDNDDGDNYWGYSTYSFFAPDRRYAHDTGPGGPTREFRQMVRAFHDRGIKVYIDVVYNHTGEGGIYGPDKPDVANIISWRGLDNPNYYELSGDPRFYYDNTGVGGNFNTADPVVRDMIVDSLRHWSQDLGVDGFRFDLAPVLGNTHERNGFDFDKMDPNNALNRAVRELPVRPPRGGPGVELIAEPWAIGTYQLGNFPSGWAEWNGKFRDTVRRSQNRLDVENVAPAELATRFAGSSDLFQDDGRKPWHSVNFLVAHDGFTLHDLYAYNAKRNIQPWPKGPSDGGSDDNISWDQGGDLALQRQAARTGMALTMLSAGVPMITGGDEFLRTLSGNNNPYNLDSEANWLNWGDRAANRPFFDFARRLIHFRGSHPALRPAEFFQGQDRNGNGLKDLTWYRDDGREPDTAYFVNPANHYLAFRVDGTEADDPAASILVGYNGWKDSVRATLPGNLPGKHWFRVGDTAQFLEADGNLREPDQEDRLDGPTYNVNGRSLLLLIER